MTTFNIDTFRSDILAVARKRYDVWGPRVDPYRGDGKRYGTLRYAKVSKVTGIPANNLSHFFSRNSKSGSVVIMLALCKRYSLDPQTYLQGYPE